MRKPSFFSTLFLAVKELRNQPSFIAFFLVNLIVGLTGYILIDAFKVSLNESMHRESRSLLGGDLIVQCDSRLCTADELAIMSQAGEVSRSVSMTTMVSANEKSRLTNLQLVSKNFPHNHPRYLDQQNPHSAVLDPELAEYLGVSPGHEVQIGLLRFNVSAKAIDDKISSGGFYDLLPRVYISDDHLNQIGLIFPGSRFNDTYFIKLNNYNPEQLRQTYLDLQERLKHDQVRIQTHLNASENLARSTNYLADYLGLMSLVTLFLAAIGSGYLFRSYLWERLNQIAIITSLGGSPNFAKTIYLTQVVILGLAASVGSLIFAVIIFPLIPIVTKEFTPIAVAPSLNLRIIFVALAMGTAGCLFASWPTLQLIDRVSPLRLLNGQKQDIERRTQDLIWYLPAVLFYLMLAVVQANSYYLGSIFVGGLLGAIACFALVGSLVFLIFESQSKVRWFNLELNLALKYLARQRGANFACFIAISMSTCMINLIPQLQTILTEELEEPASTDLPSLFIFDIQSHQIEPLKHLLTESNAAIEKVSPLVRARLVAINGENLEQDMDEIPRSANTREENDARWARNRSQNLTYRLSITKAEQILKGSDITTVFDPNSEELPQISIETRYADRLGVGLGDVLTFDIQGIEVKGRIVNTRKVRWTSFQPNFFVSFQPGVLEEAPKIYLLSVAKLNNEDKLNLQTKITRTMPNLSVLDVSRTVNSILSMLGKMSSVINIMAHLALLVSILVLFSLANYQVSQRGYDINLYKILGMGFPQISGSIIIEFFLLTAAATIVGTVAALVIGSIFALYVFDSVATMAVKPITLNCLIVIIVAVGAAALAASRVLRTKAALYLAG